MLRLRLIGRRLAQDLRLIIDLLENHYQGVQMKDFFPEERFCRLPDHGIVLNGWVSILLQVTLGTILPIFMDRIERSLILDFIKCNGPISTFTRQHFPLYNTLHHHLFIYS